MTDSEDTISLLSSSLVDLDANVAAINAVHYWLGKKHFASVVASHMIDTHREMSVEDLKAAWKGYNREFPFQAQLVMLQDRMETGLIQGADLDQSNARTAYLTMLGMMLRDASHDYREVIRSNIRQDNEASTAPSTPPAGPQTPEPRAMTPERCTSLLKELGDKSSEQPIYEFEAVGLDPPLFRARLSFRGESFEGEAGQKKLAKHYASQQACRRLNLQALHWVVAH